MGRSRYLLFPLFVATVAAMTAGCGSTSNTTNTGSTAPGTTTGTTPGTSRPTGTAPGRYDLAGSSWQLVSYQGASGSVTAASSPSTLTFAAAGVLSGSTGCNRFSGRWSANGGALTLDAGAMTQMACPDPAVTAQEAAITQGFPKVKGYVVAAGELTLTDGTTTLFTYEAASTDLAGTSWKATGINNGKGAVESTARTEKLTLTFADGGSVSGFGGCNNFTGSYQTTGGKGVTISGLASTMMACEAEAMTLETQYLAALGSVTTYEIDGDRLTLRNADGATQATYTRG